MIVSVSYRTDIPAFYAEWFLARLQAGSVRVRNPYGGPPSTLSLRPPNVEGFVFWTRNCEKFRPALAAVAAMGVPFVVQFTITGYPRSLDAATIATDRAVAQLRDLSREFGSVSVAWRYDPILSTSLTPPAWHRETFHRLADALAGAVDEVVVSWAHIYRKTARKLAAATTAGAFTWTDPLAATKQALLVELAAIAAQRRMRLSLCSQPEFAAEGVGVARCIDAERLAAIAGRPLSAARKPHRDGCGCWSSRDIGAYDSCPHGCIYCYAVTNQTIAKRRFHAHDPAHDFLTT